MFVLCAIGIKPEAESNKKSSRTVGGKHSWHCCHPSNCVNVFSEKKMASGKKSRSWRHTVTGFEM